LTLSEVATALGERLTNSLGEDVISAQRWFRVQLQRAKTDEEKEKLKEQYEMIRKIKLFEAIKRLPKTAREIYLKGK